MKKILFLLILMLVSHLAAVANSDTTYLYFDKDWKKVDKQSAVFYGKVYQHDSLWERRDYWVSGNKPQMEATYIDKEMTTPEGSYKTYYESGKLQTQRIYRKGAFQWSKNYYESGKLQDEITYNDGHPSSSTYYYESGLKQAETARMTDGTYTGKGWDETGKEVPGYVVEREARFKGGMDGWVRYLQKHLKANVAARSGAPVGKYKVVLQFVVTKEGDVTDVQVVETPKNCMACAAEAIRVVEKGPKWEPAIQLNRFVKFQALQAIIFLVEN